MIWPKIMIVDSQLENLKATEKYAKSHDGTYFAVKRGAADALEYLDTLEYDIDAIITDLDLLSLVNGVVLTERIRINEKQYRNKPLPVYWITELPFNEDDEMNLIVSAGCKLKVKRIFHKPYDFVATLDTVVKDITDSSKV